MTDLSAISLLIDGKQEIPTRDEFYTNYPLYKYWNSDSNEKFLQPDGINIYIHIPFCIQICDYCFYMKELIKSKDQVDEYVDYLCREIKLVSERFGLGRRNVNCIYFGGGTPSVLTEPQLKTIIETIYKYHSVGTPEFSFEAEPGTFNKNKILLYKECGVNRISMGVQSFDDQIIKLSHRKHSAIQAINSVKTVQDIGGFRINIDLLSGLAGERMDTWIKSLETAIEQGTDMITVYKMKTYANTNFFKKGVHGNEIELPDEMQEVAFMKKAMDTVLPAGYNMWSTFAFNKNGCESRYIENTWRGQDMVGYGASSFGKIGNYNYQNLNNMKLYFDRISNNNIPVYRTFEMTYKDRIIKELLLCTGRLFSYRKSEFIQKFGFDYFDLIPEVINELVVKGYITDSKDDLVLTRQGILFADFVSKTIASSVKNSFSKDKIGFTY